MSWLYLQALEADYSQADCLAGEQSAPSKSTNTASAFCSSDSETDSLNHSQSGMTFAPLTDGLGVVESISLPVGFLASLSVSRENGEQSLTTEIYGQIRCESFARLDRDSHSWRTRQHLLFNLTTEPYLRTWPLGLLITVVDGFAQMFSTPQRLGHRMVGQGYSLWPTPTASDALRTKLKRNAFVKQKERNAMSGHGAGVSSGSLIGAVVIAIDYCPAPEFHEWVMGMPIHWTASAPLATDKFQQWWSAHGMS